MIYNIKTLAELLDSPSTIDYHITPTGIKGLDSMLTTNAKGDSGIKSSRLYTILGCTGSGKSLFMLNLAYLLSESKNVLYVSLENTEDQTKDRLREDNLNKYHTLFLDHPTKAPALGSWDTYGVECIEDEMKQIKEKHNVDIDIVILDYLGEVSKTAERNDYEAYGKIMTRLKDMAKQYNIAIITAAQCNRDALKMYKQAKNQQEMIKALSDINEGYVSDSAKIIHISDFVSFVHRIKEISLEGFRNGTTTSALFLSVLKNRDYSSLNEKLLIPYEPKKNQLSKYSVSLL